MPRRNLVAIYLVASDTTIHISPLCEYDLYGLPMHFVWRYAEEVTIGTTAVYLSTYL